MSENLREEIARQLFDDTGVSYWRLCGHELDGCITEYKQLSEPPLELNLSEEDCMLCAQMRQDLLDVADSILSHLRSQIEQMGNPFVPDIRLIDFNIQLAEKEGYELCRLDILSKLQ